MGMVEPEPSPDGREWPQAPNATRPAANNATGKERRMDKRRRCASISGGNGRPARGVPVMPQVEFVIVASHDRSRSHMLGGKHGAVMPPPDDVAAFDRAARSCRGRIAARRARGLVNAVAFR